MTPAAKDKASRLDPVGAALAELQELVRRPPVEDTALYVNHFVVDDEGTDTTPTSIGHLADEVGAIRRLEKALNDDLRFEHLTQPVGATRRMRLIPRI